MSRPQDGSIPRFGRFPSTGAGTSRIFVVYSVKSRYVIAAGWLPQPEEVVSSVPEHSYKVDDWIGLCQVCCWLAEVVIETLKLYDAVDQYFEYFSAWKCGGNALAQVIADTDNYISAVSYTRLRILSQEQDYLHQSYFDRLNRKDKPWLNYYGGGWLHHLYHLARPVYRFNEDLRSNSTNFQSLMDSTPGGGDPRVEAIFPSRMPEYLNWSLDNNRASGSYGSYVLDEMYSCLAELYDELRSGSSAYSISQLAALVESSDFRTQAICSNLLYFPAADAQTAKDWSANAAEWLLAQQPNDVLMRLVALSERLNKRLDVVRFQALFRLWPLRYNLPMLLEARSAHD
jgi:hypothetical protein